MKQVQAVLVCLAQHRWEKPMLKHMTVDIRYSWCLGQSKQALTAFWNGCESLLCNTAGSCLPPLHTFLSPSLSVSLSSSCIPLSFSTLMSLSASCHAFPYFVSPPSPACPFIHALFFFCSLCPSTSAPLPLLSLLRRHTYTDNTAGTCCFGNILQQENVLHCSPLTQ